MNDGSAMSRSADARAGGGVRGLDRTEDHRGQLSRCAVPVGGGRIAKVGGVEEEFLFEGTATQYRPAGRSGSDYPADGRWDVEPMSQARFRSRLHVLRPGIPTR